VIEAPADVGGLDPQMSYSPRCIVSSLLGVLGIALVLFFVVALTARLILGR
jgi:hypothetical protein